MDRDEIEYLKDLSALLSKLRGSQIVLDNPQEYPRQHTRLRDHGVTEEVLENLEDLTEDALEDLHSSTNWKRWAIKRAAKMDPREIQRRSLAAIQEIRKGLNRD